jgi:cytoskeleton protein RodZ
MQADENMPLQQWAEQLRSARQAQSLSLGELARELLLSDAQVRGIETASLDAFHGVGYYVRAVEKYAKRLHVTLDPAAQTLTLTDSQLALERYKRSASTSRLARKQSDLQHADRMPTPSRRTRIGVALISVVLVLFVAGIWLALQEGWPGLTAEKQAVSSPDKPISQSAVSGQPDTVAASAEVDSPASTPAAPENPPASASEPAGVLQNDMTASSDSNTSFADGGAMAALPTQPIAAADTTPTETATQTTPLDPPVKPDAITVTFTAECWVEVRYTDGRNDQGIYKSGDVLEILVADVERITFGNAQAVQASRFEQPFDIMTFTKSGNNVARLYRTDLR